MQRGRSGPAETGRRDVERAQPFLRQGLRPFLRQGLRAAPLRLGEHNCAQAEVPVLLGMPVLLRRMKRSARGTFVPGLGAFWGHFGRKWFVLGVFWRAFFSLHKFDNRTQIGEKK